MINGIVSINAAVSTNSLAAAKPKFTKSQITRRLLELRRLHEKGLLTDASYHEKMDECGPSDNP